MKVTAKRIEKIVATSFGSDKFKVEKLENGNVEFRYDGDIYESINNYFSDGLLDTRIEKFLKCTNNLDYDFQNSSTMIFFND